MGANATDREQQLAEVRRRLSEDQAFRSAAETDLEGTLRKTGLSPELASRFVLSDTDEHGNTAMGVRKQIWVCEIEGDSKQCWCTNCPIA